MAAAVEAGFADRRSVLESDARAARLEGERLDLTEVRTQVTRGHAHLVTQARDRLEDVFVAVTRDADTG